MARHLGNAGIVVASGLARGIDTAAHQSAIQNQYPTIAVLGTPITRAYPKENEKIQQLISKEGLVVSQFPPSSPVQRWFFSDEKCCNERYFACHSNRGSW